MAIKALNKTSKFSALFNKFKVLFCVSLFLMLVTTNLVMAMDTEKNSIEEVFSKKLDKEIESHMHTEDGTLLFIKYKDNSAELIKIDEKTKTGKTIREFKIVGNYYFFNNNKILLIEYRNNVTELFNIGTEGTIKNSFTLNSVKSYKFYNDISDPVIKLHNNNKVLEVTNEDETEDIYDVDKAQLLVKNNKYFKSTDDHIFSQDKEKTLKIYKINNQK